MGTNAIKPPPGFYIEKQKNGSTLLTNVAPGKRTLPALPKGFRIETKPNKAPLLTNVQPTVKAQTPKPPVGFKIEKPSDGMSTISKVARTALKFTPIGMYTTANTIKNMIKDGRAPKVMPGENEAQYKKRFLQEANNNIIKEGTMSQLSPVMTAGAAAGFMAAPAETLTMLGIFTALHFHTENLGLGKKISNIKNPTTRDAADIARNAVEGIISGGLSLKSFKRADKIVEVKTKGKPGLKAQVDNLIKTLRDKNAQTTQPSISSEPTPPEGFQIESRPQPIRPTASSVAVPQRAAPKSAANLTPPEGFVVEELKISPSESASKKAKKVQDLEMARKEFEAKGNKTAVKRIQQRIDQAKASWTPEEIIAHENIDNIANPNAVEIPKFKGTIPAVKFGQENSNNPEVLNALKTKMEEALAKGDEIRKLGDNATDAQMQEIQNSAYEAQLYREALGGASGEIKDPQASLDRVKNVPVTPIEPLKEPTRTNINSESGQALNPTPNLPSASAAGKLGKWLQYWMGTQEERFKSFTDPETGREIFEKKRLAERSLNLVNAMTEKRNAQIFKGISHPEREHIFDIAKGMQSKLDEQGNIVFGALQPAGEVTPAELLTATATKDGTLVLPDGRIIDKTTFSPDEVDKRAIQSYRYFNTQKEYEALIKRNPKVEGVIKKYLASEEDLQTTILGTPLPAFAREVMKEQFNINTRHPAAYSYVPSVPKEQRLLSQIKNIFRSYTAGGRMKKTGSLAEQNLEEKDLLKAYTVRQTQYNYENIMNDLAGDVLALTLEPIVGRQVKPGYVQLNINHPRVAKIVELKKAVLEANGILPDEKSLYQYPAELEREFKIQHDMQFGDPDLAAASKVMKSLGNTLVKGITSNWLIRLSTAVRNFNSGAIQYNLKTLTHLYEGILGKSGSFRALGEDMQGLVRALHPKTIKAIPAEAMGDVFVSDVTGNKSIFSKLLIPFREVDRYFKRASFVSDLRMVAFNKLREMQKSGTPIPAKDRAQYLRDFQRNFFLDLFQEMSDTAHSITFDYANKPYFLEKLPKALVPFPNYFYHKMRMYAEYGPGAFVGINKGNAKTRIAKALAGLTTGLVAWGITSDAIEKRKKQKENLSLKKMDFTFDTTGRIKVSSNEEFDRWLRVYDLPYIGDVMYYREIMNGDAEFSDWTRDSIAAGPLFATPAALMGLKTQYEKYKPTSAVLGQQAAGWIPFGAYLNYARILADPVKRETSSEDFNAFQNFFNPIINTMPVLSRALPEDVGTIGVDKGQVRKYDIPSETSKMFFLNIKSVDKKEYLHYVVDQKTSGKQEKRMKIQARTEYKHTHSKAEYDQYLLSERNKVKQTRRNKHK